MVRKARPSARRVWSNIGERLLETGDPLLIRRPTLTNLDDRFVDCAAREAPVVSFEAGSASSSDVENRSVSTLTQLDSGKLAGSMFDT